MWGASHAENSSQTAAIRKRIRLSTPLIADTASVRQWLAEGVSFADILTMLEVRRRFEFSAHDCRIYAVEILLAVTTEIRNPTQPQITH